jgi:hypothetical protein
MMALLTVFPAQENGVMPVWVGAVELWADGLIALGAAVTAGVGLVFGAALRASYSANSPEISSSLLLPKIAMGSPAGT